MKSKEQFLSGLTGELERRGMDDKDVVEYYSEIIDERIAAGDSEKNAIEALGDIDEVMKDIEANQQLSEAVKKPTVSNGLKALVAVLGVLSLPVLIPVAAVIFAFLVSFLAIVFSIIVTLIALIVAAVVTLVGIIVGVFAGELPVAWLVLAIGALLIIIPLCIEGIRGLIFIVRKLVMWIAKRVNRKSNKGVKK